MLTVILLMLTVAAMLAHDTNKILAKYEGGERQ